MRYYTPPNVLWELRRCEGERAGIARASVGYHRHAAIIINNQS